MHFVTLAEMVGIDPKSLSYIENGRNYPTHENLENIAKALNVKPKVLYDFEHHKNLNEIKEDLCKRISPKRIQPKCLFRR